MSKYTTHGDICHGCGHLHLTHEAAERCADAHHRACAKQGGYSDRSVVAIDVATAKADGEDPLRNHHDGQQLRMYYEVGTC